mgnify:CR=1 FL=1
MHSNHVINVVNQTIDNISLIEQVQIDVNLVH